MPRRHRRCDQTDIGSSGILQAADDGKCGFPSIARPTPVAPSGFGRCGTPFGWRRIARESDGSGSTISVTRPPRCFLTGGEELAVIWKVLGHADHGTDPKRARAAASRIEVALGRSLPALEEVGS